MLSPHSITPLIFCAVPFREPVNWRELGLDDYPKIVKKPMALSDVKSKLLGGQYRNPVSRL